MASGTSEEGLAASTQGSFLLGGKALTTEYLSEDDMIQNVFATLQHAPRLMDRHRILFDGHTMTHAHALVLLSRLGYGSVARKGYELHRVRMEKNRGLQAQHLNGALDRKGHRQRPSLHACFLGWDFEQNDRQWEFGHIFKYFYSFYDFANRIDNPYRKRFCEQQLAYLI